MLPNEFAQGAEVIIWGRPETDLLLLFGEGRYAGSTFVNGNYYPTIKLVDGREVTVHQSGVWVGSKDAVVRQCKAFTGDVISWDLQRFLQGEKPTREQRVKSTMSGTTGTNNAALPPPKTATDKLMYLKREIALEESKKRLAQQMIDAANEVIKVKLVETDDEDEVLIMEK